MKKIVLTSVAAVALMIAGCSKKEPEVAVQTTPSMTDAQRLAALANQIQGQVQNVYFAFDKYSVDAQGKAAANNNTALITTKLGQRHLKSKLKVTAMSGVQMSTTMLLKRKKS